MTTEVEQEAYKVRALERAYIRLEQTLRNLDNAKAALECAVLELENAKRGHS